MSTQRRHKRHRPSLPKLAGALALVLAGLISSPSSARADETAITPFIMYVYASGGWDTTMVLENKLGNGYTTREDGAVAAKGAGDIPYIDHPDRPAVKTFFDTYGAAAAIVNGIDVGSMSIEVAQRNLLAATPTQGPRPVDWVSYYASSTSPVMAIPHAVIDAPFVPGDYSSVAVRLTGATIAHHAAGTIAGAEPLGDDAEKALQTFRDAAYKDVYKIAHEKSLDGEKLRSLYYGYAREPLVAASVAKAATTVGEQGEASDFLYRAKLAVELFAQGDSIAATLQAGRSSLWESPSRHFARQSAAWQELFADLLVVLDYAKARGVGDRLLLIVASERGRAPLVNAQGGKSPWPYTSLLLWGAGVRGGAVAGETDPALRGLRIDPLFGARDDERGVVPTMANVWAAIYLKTNVATKPVLADSVLPLSPIIAKKE